MKLLISPAYGAQAPRVGGCEQCISRPPVALSGAVSEARMSAATGLPSRTGAVPSEAPQESDCSTYDLGGRAAAVNLDRSQHKRPADVEGSQGQRKKRSMAAAESSQVEVPGNVSAAAKLCKYMAYKQPQVAVMQACTRIGDRPQQYRPGVKHTYTAQLYAMSAERRLLLSRHIFNKPGRSRGKPTRSSYAKRAEHSANI